MDPIMTNGMSMTSICLVAVVVALVVLIAVVKGLEKILLSMGGVKPGSGKSAKNSAPIVVQTTEVGGDEIVAVITAAITAMMEAEGKKSGGFVVRSIRRVNNAPAWNRAGREEQIYSRM